MSREEEVMFNANRLSKSSEFNKTINTTTVKKKSIDRSNMLPYFDKNELQKRIFLETNKQKAKIFFPMPKLKDWSDVTSSATGRNLLTERHKGSKGFISPCQTFTRKNSNKLKTRMPSALCISRLNFGEYQPVLVERKMLKSQMISFKNSRKASNEQ